MADLLKTYQQMADKARLSNLETKAQVEAIHNEIIKRYEPGGSFLTQGEGIIQSGKRKTTGEQMHQLISSGLYGTTTPGALGQKYEEEVATPARFKLEDVAMERLSQAQLGKASFLENIQNPYPDSSLLLQAYAAQGSKSTKPQEITYSSGGSQSTSNWDANWGVGYTGKPGGDSLGGGSMGGITPSYSPTPTPSAPSSYGSAGGVSPSGSKYLGIAGLQGGGTSTQPKGTGTISGPKGTTKIGNVSDPTTKIAEWEAYIQGMKTGANPKRISIGDAQRELAYWQHELSYQSGQTG